MAGSRAAANSRRANAFVVHPYGRYCNANKFAGEIDLFEAIDDIKKHYPIDEDRLVMRGFSMGGAACWQFAVHYPERVGRGGARGRLLRDGRLPKVFQNETVKPTWYEKKLWHLYDCTDYALNLFNCPTVAYSGEIDRQKQAADMMAKALAKEGIELVHVIGAKAGHKYTPEAKDEINRRIDSIVEQSAAIRCRSRFSSPPGRCATTARSGSRSTVWKSTGSGPASTPICSAATGSGPRSSPRTSPP